ncbi:MAG: nitroreductase family protein [Methylophilus sp.]
MSDFAIKHGDQAPIGKQMVAELLDIAALSPSSHNTQPWTVRINDTDSFTIGYDVQRQLMVGDPHKRELFMSLGCFIQSIILAADDAGYGAQYTFINATDNTQVAHISLNIQDSPLTNGQPWQKLIQSRRSDRRPYSSQILDPEAIKKLTGLQQGHTRLQLYTAAADIAFLAQVTKVATQKIMSQQDFRDELAHWVRNNWTKQSDGMPGYTQGMPGPISLLAKIVIKNSKSVAADQAKKDALRVTKSAAVGLLCLPSGNKPTDWIDAGMLYQRLCLEAQLLGISTSAVSAAVIDDSTTSEITQHFTLHDQPVALMRFGYALDKSTPKSAPKRTSQQIII